MHNSDNTDTPETPRDAHTHGYQAMDHIPVLLHELIEALNIQPNGTYLDGTLGAAGHASRAAAMLSPSGTFVGIDRDWRSIQHAQEAFEKNDDISCNYDFYNGSFEDMDQIIETHNLGKINGMMIDLGWNMDQFDDGERGFSFQNDGPLDMRYNQDQALTAADLLAFTQEDHLANLIFNYSDERQSRKIARAIVAARRDEPITTTKQLADMIKNLIPLRFQNKRIHPATKTFQALRIAVNDEYGHIERGIPAILNHLEIGGRLAIITFHSGEDRIVKNIFRDLETNSPDTYRRINKKGITASEKELSMNPRARSARLRTIELLS